MARYSASAEDRETMYCFNVFQESGEPPSIMNQPVRECRVAGHVFQLASHHGAEREEYEHKVVSPILDLVSDNGLLLEQLPSPILSEHS